MFFKHFLAMIYTKHTMLKNAYFYLISVSSKLDQNSLWVDPNVTSVYQLTFLPKTFLNGCIYAKWAFKSETEIFKP